MQSQNLFSGKNEKNILKCCLFDVLTICAYLNVQFLTSTGRS